MTTPRTKHSGRKGGPSKPKPQGKAAGSSKPKTRKKSAPKKKKDFSSDDKRSDKYIGTKAKIPELLPDFLGALTNELPSFIYDLWQGRT